MEEQQLKRQRSSPHPHVPCARCASGDTKFCYYNNYNASQPRYHCRACRRYWTHGGALRNVPQGGSSKKGKQKPSAVGAALRLPREHVQRDGAAAPGGIGNWNERTPLLQQPTQFFCGGGGDFVGEDICLLPGLINPSGMIGDMICRPIPPGFVINPLDGIDLQQLAQQTCLSTAPQPSFVMLQQQQGNVGAVDFAAGTAVTAAAAADTITKEIRSRSNSSFQHMSGTSFHPLPPSSSFM